MKRILFSLLVISLFLSLGACGNSDTPQTTEETPAQTTEATTTSLSSTVTSTSDSTLELVTTESSQVTATTITTTAQTTTEPQTAPATTPPITTTPVETTSVTTIFDPTCFEDILEAEAESAEQLLSELSADLLTKLGSTYEGYLSNQDAIESFYQKSIALSNAFYLNLASYNASLYRWVAEQGIGYSDWNDAIDDCSNAWNDAMDNYSDAWNDIYDDVYEAQDELLSAAMNTISYAEWSDLWSEMYDTHWDAWSELYDAHWDAWSDIYELHWDIWGKFFSGDWTIEDIEGILTDSDILESMSPLVTTVATTKAPTVATESTPPTVSFSVEELSAQLFNELDTTIADLLAESETLFAKTDTYDKYVTNQTSVEAFYETILTETSRLGILLREYSVKYAQAIMATDRTNKEKYNDIDTIYDDIYDDAADDIYEEIYEYLLDEMYDHFYDGVISDAYDLVAYAEYSAARSDAYEWYSETRSDVYKIYSKTRSDIYEFRSDLRSELYGNKTDDAYETIEDFIEDIEKLKK